MTRATTGRSYGDRVAELALRMSQPRTILLLCTFGLVCFGLLMIYSSSSIVAMLSRDSDYKATFYLAHQAQFVVAGIGAAFVVAKFDYHLWASKLLPVIWVATLILLVLVFTSIAGCEAYGAQRWIRLGTFNLQPSEFAKLTVILTATNLASRYFEEHSIDLLTFALLMVFGVVVPIALIFFQPDKGSTMICGATLLVMGYLCGMSRKAIKILVVVGIVGIIFASMKDAYSRARVMTLFDPFRDEYGDGYQVIQGIYAFASGGLFGVGIGNSHQKYFYLPMSHNDFIFAVIGEELGLVGTLGVLAAFALLVWAGFQIARYAPDLMGKLIAAGCTSMILIQLLVNVCGVLCIIPLSGKPLPFISYGGSSILSCLLLVGFILSVSLHSPLPEPAYEPQRHTGSFEAQDLVSDRLGEFSLVGEPTLRSARSSRPATVNASATSARSARPARVNLGSSSRRLRTSASSAQPGRVGDVSVEGLRASRSFNESHRFTRVTTDSSGRRRIDLGPSAADRLRSSHQ